MNILKPGYFIVAIPLLCWFVSYLYLAFYHGRWNIFKVRIHESGRYTLLSTIFYFNHFLRELFLDTFLALAIYWTYRLTHPEISGGGLDDYFTYILITLIAYLGFVFFGSLRAVGLKNTLLDLFQYRELDTVVAFGSHWQMHFLSSLVLLVLIIFPALFQGAEDWRQIAMLFIAFIAVSLLFKTGLKAVRDRRWLLHGGRELLTFFPLVVLPSYMLNLQPFSLSLNLGTMVIMILIGAILMYYAVVFLGSDVRGLAQGDFGIVYLIASHFFEHVLDYVYILLFVAMLVLF